MHPPVREGIWSTLRASMTAATEVSAVLPVHNGSAYVAEAIRSILGQTRPPIECLVIDDGSTDGTGEIVRQFGRDVAYVRQDRSGVSSARNHGAALAHSALVAFLDHDDVWLPTKLERQLETFAASRAAITLCALDVVDERGTVRRTMRLRPRGDLITGMLTFDGTETVSVQLGRTHTTRAAAQDRRLRSCPVGVGRLGPSVQDGARRRPRLRR